MSFIQINNISKYYIHGDKSLAALQNVSFSIEKGTFVSIIGGSGCGKTTLLNLMAGFEAPTHGSIVIDKIQVTKPVYKHQTIFQNYGLLPWRNIEGNVAFALENNNQLTKKEKQARVLNYIDMVGLTPYLRMFPHQISGGMKQRVAIARALTTQADVIFMDEPFGALDAINRMKLQDELLNICSLQSKTIVMVTHDIDEAIYLSDRIIVMQPAPNNIVCEIVPDLPKPCQRSSEAFLKQRAQLLEILHLAAKQKPIEYNI